MWRPLPPPTGILPPVAGTSAVDCIIWALIWVVRPVPASEKSTAQLALYLAVISLTIGAILGVLLGIFVANGSLPGLSTERASALAGAHPAAMLIGYLILAGVAISHWVLDGGQGILGRLVAWALFVAGLIANIAFIFEIEALIQVFSGLQVIAIIAYVVHMWGKIRPRAPGPAIAPPTSDERAVLGLVVGIGLLVYVVQLVTSGELDPETQRGPDRCPHRLRPRHVHRSHDQCPLRGGGGMAAVKAATNRMVLVAVNLGLVLFLIGLVNDSAILKQIGTPILGVGPPVCDRHLLARIGSRRGRRCLMCLRTLLCRRR